MFLLIVHFFFIVGGGGGIGIYLPCNIYDYCENIDLQQYMIPFLKLSLIMDIVFTILIVSLFEYRLCVA